jgi:hypothetical protein
MAETLAILIENPCGCKLAGIFFIIVGYIIFIESSVDSRDICAFLSINCTCLKLMKLALLDHLFAG